ncbi:syndecan-4 isoform X2 [Pagrus major]|uniref:syndecan-4 isoform X2 n=1 Tax=Pagrus major TaxID=143350 RepID=UPI003CC8E0E7
MLSLCLVLMLSASVCPESVRETETWMPMKTTQTAAMLTHHDNLESSGSDFGFTDDEDDQDEYGVNDGEGDYKETLYDDDEDYEDEEYDDDFSGSGDQTTTVSPGREAKTSAKPNVNDNKIPDVERPVRPTINEVIIQNGNEIPLLRNGAEPGEEHPSNVLMSHASEDSILKKTEVLAALITGGAVCLMFAVLLILLLIYRMKKKDEGSYDLGKKPIYKKAPTTEIYA